MTTLVLGTAGSIVGGMIGGPIGANLGWLAGNLLGNLIDPPKVEGPRLSDLKLQVSEYGKPIPRVYGTGRLAGVVIDQTDLQEHKETSGGKGGPEVTTYTYSASFDILLCVGPIVGVNRIWADGRLIWSASSGDAMPCTLYTGTDDQDPDPIFEAIHGVGNLPAYRGYAHVVFADYMLTDFGNRIPVLEFEVFTAAGNIPWRVSTFDPWPDAALTIVGTALYVDGLVQTWVGESSNGYNWWFRKFNIAGVDQGGSSTGYFSDYRALTHVQNKIIQAVVNYHTGIDYYWTSFNYTLGVELGAEIPGAETNGQATNGNALIFQNDAIYTVANKTSTTYIGKYAAAGGIGGAFETSVALDNAYSPSTVKLGTSNFGSIFVAIATTGSPGGVKLWELDEQDLSTIRFWDGNQTDHTHLSANTNFHVYRSSILGVTMIVTEYTHGGLWYVSLTKINADDTLENYANELQHSRGGSISLRGGLLIDRDGIYSLDPPPAKVLLADIVSDLSDLTDVGSYDVSELTDEVNWFSVASQMTVRNALEPLRKAFQFDAVESDYSIKFRKRGATDSVVTFSDADLTARREGEEPRDDLETTRKKEKGMPRNVTLSYIDIDTDYQKGARNSPRITTLSDSDVTLEVPIGFTATEAQQVAWKLQLSEWIERETFAWTSTREYAWLEPCDVATVRGRVIRITAVTESPDGLISWQGVLHRASVYTQEQTGEGSVGFVEQPESVTPVTTELILLDIPILSQNDPPFGYYAAMGPSASGRWSGASLYKSLDGGVNYSKTAFTSIPAVIGTVVSSDIVGGGSPTVANSLSVYSGDTVDETSICVRLSNPDAELVSCTGTGLENGENYCAISFGSAGGSPVQQRWELCQYRDAVLVAAGAYILTGFKRGRKGTETSGHALLDRFVLLSTVIAVDAPESELNHTYLYKAVTSGLALADTSSQEFCNTGLGADEYYDTEIEHLPVFGENPVPGSPSGQGPGTVPGFDGDCDPEKFLNQCGDWAVPAGSGGSGSPAGGGSIEVRNEGVTLTSAAAIVDFTGTGVNATYSGGVVTVNVPGGGSGAGSPAFSGTVGGTFSIPGLVINNGIIEFATAIPTVGRIYTLDEGNPVDATAIALNFTGNLVQATDAGAGVTTVDINGVAQGAEVFLRTAHSSAPNGIVLVAGSGISFTEGGGSPPSTLTIASTVTPGGNTQAQEFTSSGTFNVPTGVEMVWLVMIGGGGGGSARNAAASGGSGGGMGELVQNLAVPVTPGAAVTVTVGGGGNGASSGVGANTAGTDGTDTSFGSTWVAKGGKGGASTGQGGAGGGARGATGGGAGNPAAAGTVGTAVSPTAFGGSSGGGGGSATNANGAAGGGSQGVPTGGAGGTSAGAQAGGGGGAASPWGIGGAGGNGGADGSAAASTSYGAGGGGGGGQATTTRAAGRGCDGYVFVYWVG